MSISYEESKLDEKTTKILLDIISLAPSNNNFMLISYLSRLSEVFGEEFDPRIALRSIIKSAQMMLNEFK